MRSASARPKDRRRGNGSRRTGAARASSLSRVPSQLCPVTRARRQVDGEAVQPIGRRIADRLGRDVAREVPRGDDVRRRVPAGIASAPERLDLGAVERAGGEPGPFDPAVEAAADRGGRGGSSPSSSASCQAANRNCGPGRKPRTDFSMLTEHGAVIVRSPIAVAWSRAMPLLASKLAASRYQRRASSGVPHPSTIGSPPSPSAAPACRPRRSSARSRCARSRSRCRGSPVAACRAASARPSPAP